MVVVDIGEVNKSIQQQIELLPGNLFKDDG